MNIADYIAPLLSTTQWIMLIMFGGAIAVAMFEHQVVPRLRRSIRALRASQNATAHHAPSLSTQQRLHVSRRPDWKLAAPHQGLAAYKQRKASGLH